MVLRIPPFDIDGIATYDVAKDSQDGLGVAIQSDGKIVVAGKTYNGSDYNYDVVVLRCTTTGSLDATFGTGGIVTYDGTFGMILVTE